MKISRSPFSSLSIWTSFIWLNLNTLKVYVFTHRWIADIAFVDRADIKAYVGPPTLQARYEILRSCLQELMRKAILSSFQVQILLSHIVQGTIFFQPSILSSLHQMLMWTCWHISIVTNKHWEFCRIVITSYFPIIPVWKRSWICLGRWKFRHHFTCVSNCLKLQKLVR